MVVITKGGWDIDTSDRTQRTGDCGHIHSAYQMEDLLMYLKMMINNFICLEKCVVLLLRPHTPLFLLSF